MHFDYTPRGVCSRAIHIDLSDDGKTIEQVSFEGGCNGNLKAVSKLVAGHTVDEITGILAGNTCGPAHLLRRPARARPHRGLRAGHRLAMRLPRPKPTRRSFLKAAAAGSAVAVVAAGALSGCSHTGDEINSDPVVVDEDSAEDILESFESVDAELVEEASWRLPLSNVLHPAEGTWIPVTTAGASATPMVVASALSLASGALSEVVSEPVGHDTTTVIYDVRCSDYLYAWTELDLQTRAWTLYAAPFSGGALAASPPALWEGDADFDPAPFAVTGRSVIWQVQPSTGGVDEHGELRCCLPAGTDGRRRGAARRRVPGPVRHRANRLGRRRRPHAARPRRRGRVLRGDGLLPLGRPGDPSRPARHAPERATVPRHPRGRAVSRLG